MYKFQETQTPKKMTTAKTLRKLGDHFNRILLSVINAIFKDTDSSLRKEKVKPFQSVLFHKSVF